MRGVRGARSEFERKIAVYSKRRNEAIADAKDLEAHLGAFQALAGKASGGAPGGDAAKAPPAGRSSPPQSQITGDTNEPDLP
jgi:hypothetical protein